MILVPCHQGNPAATGGYCRPGVLLIMKRHGHSSDFSRYAPPAPVHLGPRGQRVVVLAGTGGNGDAPVCARRLHNCQVSVSALVTRPDVDFAPVPGQQLAVLRRMGVPIHPVEALAQAVLPELVIDGVVGCSLKGATQPPG